MLERRIIGITTVMLLATPGWAQTPTDPTPDPAPVAIDDDGRGTPYVVDKSDNICGIGEPRALSNPAKVDYGDLLAATPEVKRIKRKRIDPDSARGIKLMTEARRKVLAACEAVRADEGYCSIWKDIERRDKTPIDDVTTKVKAEIDDDVPA